MKKALICFLCMCIVLSVPNVAFAGDIIAERTLSNVYVNGKYKAFQAFNIADNNYFKLRDIAYVLNGSDKEFDVKWDEKNNAIQITSGKSYTEVGGEMQRSYYYTSSKASPAKAKVYLDGKQINLTAYTITNNNYFKLRDVGKALDFSVEWNPKNGNIDIETAYSYSDTTYNTYELRRGVDVDDTNTTYVNNWATVSSVQQFKYMNQGLAYAYIADHMLNIVTPEQKFKVDVKYPLLGDVISDDDGNFYVVWGRENENENYNTNTVFISKYSPKGEHIKTRGFVGESIMGEDGNTKAPFGHGNCSSAIANGCLMVNYARKMYNGHQSNNVVGVKISDMSPVEFESVWDIPYTSHSFNQRVIWSELADDFVYADHGDAYGRGFIISKSGSEKNIFNFYLQPNANYNMYIVNKTFAQLGALLETSEGVVLVGASAKSISEKAKEEKQNLFVQIFDPDATGISEDMFVGGKTRKGATSLDINDNENSPLTPVTDYGVHWITYHENSNVVAPHAVVADDNIVILWNKVNSDSAEAFYTVLSNTGKFIKAPTSLGVGRKLNSNEDPIYHNGSVYWASAANGKIRVESIKIF